MSLGFLLVISIIFALYGAMHVYAYHKLTTLVSLGAAAHWVVILCFAVMTIAPLLIALLTRMKLVGLATPLAQVAYLWMGWLFLFFSFSMFFGLFQLMVEVCGKWFDFNVGRLLPAPPSVTLLVAGAALLAVGYGLWSARHVQVEPIHITSAKLPAGSKPIRIVQISDLHLGLTTDRDNVARLVETIASLHPDVVVSTGDLIDMQMDHLAPYAELFKQITPRYGKFAVTGNHEAIAGLQDALTFTREAGFRMLRGEGVTVAGVINIVGVDDPAVLRQSGAVAPREWDLLARYPRSEFTLLLKHQPRVAAQSLPEFDLQLSGHVHGGQVFPFNWITRLFYPVATGLTRVGEHAQLYVSRGTGTWGPPIRFLAPPELTVIELQRAQ